MIKQKATKSKSQNEILKHNCLQCKTDFSKDDKVSMEDWRNARLCSSECFDKFINY